MLNEIFIISFLCTIIILFFWKKNFEIASALNLFDDVKSSRKKKKKKTPLTGGLIILSFFYLFYFFNLFELIVFEQIKYEINTITYFVLVNLIFLLGLLDDKKDLSPNIKLFSFAIIFLISILYDQKLLIDFLIFKDFDINLNIHSISIFFIIFCLIVFVNASNMFDGINLQCSSYFLFLNIYLQAVIGYDPFLTLLMIGLCFFIILNSKNKSYLGDSGVYILSFIMGIIIIKLYNEGYLFCDQILLMMLIPGVDMIRLTFLRILNGRHPFKADNYHIHHILGLKFDETKVFIITLSLIVIPNLLGLLFDSYLFFILISLYLYFYIVSKFKNVRKKIK